MVDLNTLAELMSLLPILVKIWLLHVNAQTTQPLYILVMDSLEECNTSASHDTQSLHYVNSYGVLDRVSLTSCIPINTKNLPLSLHSSLVPKTVWHLHLFCWLGF